LAQFCLTLLDKKNVLITKVWNVFPKQTEKRMLLRKTISYYSTYYLTVWSLS
jgi:hypothetical protein